KRIVSGDADFLGAWLMPMTFTKQFSEGRKDPETMSRLVVFDSNYSLTGANADIRVRIKPSQQLDVVLGLLHEIVVKKGRSSYAGNGSVKSVIESGAGAAGRLGIEPALLTQIAEDLWENRGQSLVVAGGLPTLTSKATDLQIAVNLLNSVLDNDGKTVEGRGANPGLKGSWADLFALIKDMKEGKVKTLVMHNVNPGYVLSDEHGFADALRKVEMIVSTADRVDETSGEAHYIIPDNHALESWGDAEPVAGVVMIQQPTIRPMYETRAFQTSLLNWARLAEVGPARLKNSETFYDYVRTVWREDVAPKYGRGMAFETFWG
ncbi:MAG TPA: molybdopterin oxidoreductase, partial [Pseudobdellovibrionaceae bacterium]|nr:molybdopterin oxidoreductase [Pseudobdellovibrionaceae bacterium]